jgi:hypothetical protein
MFQIKQYDEIWMILGPRNRHLVAGSSQRSNTMQPRFKSMMAFLQISADLPLGIIQTE